MTTPNIEPLESRIAPATLSIAAPAATNEGSGGGTTQFNFTVTLDAAVSETVTVLASVVDGSATGADGDFVPQADVSVEFAPGQTSRTFTVNVGKDGKFETNEDFRVVLSSPSGSHALHATAFEAVGTITNDDAAPTIGFAPAVVKVGEGSAGVTPLSFTVKLSNASHQDVEFDWATDFSMAANAADGADFLAVGTTHVVIPAGSTEAVLVVNVNGDTDDEVEEVFFANLANVMMGGSGLTVTNAQATGRIGNDEVLVSLTGAPTVAEGNSGTVNAAFTVSIPAAQAFDVTVEFDVVGSGANAAAVPADVQVPTSVVIPAGSTSAVVNVQVVGDTLFELTETFDLRVNNVINGAADPGFSSATGTITDNDAASQPTVSIVQLDSVKNEGTGGMAGTTYTFRVQLDRASGADVTVDVSTVDGTATGADGDFVSQLSVPVTIPAGQTQATFTVVVNHDNKFESDETFGVQLSGLVNATLGAGFAQGTIRNDDALPTLNINDVSIAEGNAGETDYTFTVTLSNAADRAVTFTWATAPGTATEGADYTAVAGTLVTIPAGQTTASLTVKVTGDGVSEADETFFVNLSNAAAGALPLTITDAQGQGTITNDELSVELGPDVTVSEADGTANFSLVLTGALPSSDAVEVTYRVVSGTAMAGSDFTVPATSKVTIPAGSSSAVISIPIINDNLFEGASEQFSIEILSVKNAMQGARSSATGTITENDAVPEIGISDQTITEGNSGTKTITFTVSLDRPASEAVTFDWETAVGLGTATAGVDYTAVAAGGKPVASVTIAPGQVDKTISVTVAGDLIFEKNETFFVNLLSPLLGGMAIAFEGGDSQAQGTITNDDATPVLTVGDATVLENDASGMLVFNVSIAGPADQDITFDWGTVLGTATAGVDYTVVSSAVGTILAGQTTAQMTVAVSGDTDDELDETLFVNLANAKLADGTPLAFQSGDSQGKGTIQNDDLTVSITQPTINAPESGSATVTLSLDAVSAHDVIVEVTFTPGTAVAGADYTTPAVVTRTIPAGQLTADVLVPFVNDTTREGDESFSASITKVTNATKGAAGSVAITIEDDDAVPTIAIEDARVEEGDNGTKLLTFIVRLSNAVTQDVSFDWTTMDAVAVSTGVSADFIASGADDVIIPAGQTTKTVSVVINGDVVDEGDETFFVNLSDAKLGGLVDPLFVIAPGGDQAVGTIENDDVTVRISNASLTEGNAGTQLMNFTVSLDKLTTRPVDLTLSLENVSAVLGKDYDSPGSMLVTIPVGSQSAVFSVPVLGDFLDEVNETFTARITDAMNAKVGNATAAGTIIDDDATPILSIGNVTLVEGNAGTTEMVFTVTLSEASGQTVSVSASTIDGSAISAAVSGNPADFGAKSESLVFLTERPDPGNPGQFLPAETSKEVRVTINGDALNELDESFTVQLSNGVGALISQTEGTATATIQNDDAQPTLSITNVALAEGSGSGTTTYTFTVALSAVSGLPVTVTASTLDGTALAGSDYTAKTEGLSIPAGQLSTTFNVVVTNDAFFELDEAFTVNLSNAVNAGISSGTGTGTILNDEQLPTLSIGNLTVVEGDADTKEVEFLVTLSSVQSSDVTFDWQTANGSADGADFVPVGATTVTIPAGQTTAKLKVTLNGDTADELDEEFFANVSNGLLLGNALAFTKAQGTGKILNDDLTVGVVGGIQVNEGDTGQVDATFMIRLSAASTHAVTVSYATQDGTATSTGAAADFQAVSGTVTFAPGETEKSVTVKVNGDVNFDTANAFNLVLSQPVNAKLGVASGTATIIEEATDARPAIGIAGVSLAENADGGATTTFRFTVTLDHASDETVVVTAQTVAGTALAGLDFTAKTQSLTFTPGQTVNSFDVVVQNDSVFEAQEQFRVVLSDPINASITAGEALGVIDPDGDLAPRLKVTPQSVIEGNSGTQVMSFVVERIGDTEAPVTFDFRTLVEAGDTATSGVDFVALDQQFTILPGESSVTVNVLVNGDLDDEATETFSVELANVAGGRIDPVGDGKAQGTIFNDDLTVNFSQSNFSVLEGDSGQSDLVYVVALSAVSSHDVTVTYTIAAGTATEGVDYQNPTLLTLTIPAGQASGEIRVPVLGDAVGENEETLSVTLTSVTDAQLGTTLTTATGTILNDDAAITISDGHVVEGANGTTNMVFIVSLANASVFPVTVNYTTAAVTGSGAATAGTDYGVTGEVSGSLTFASGETEKQIIVPIKGDTVVEGDERFSVVLGDPLANGVAIDALVDNEATGTIQDDEVFLSINDVTVIEGDSGTKQAIFTISLTPSSTFAVTVVASTLDFSAESVGGSPDFVAKTQTITFNAGQTTQTFAVTINGDLAFEPASEQFKVVLSGAAGALVVDGEGVGTINQSNDSAPTVSIADATIIEGDAGTKVMEFVVGLSQPAGADVLVDIATTFGAGSGAADGTDIVPVSIPGFVIPAGQTTATFSVTLNGDTTDEADETFSVNLANARTTLPGDPSPTPLTLGDSQATGRILNDDLSVSIAPTASDTEGDTGTKAFTIPVNLSAVSSHDVTVTYNVSAGTAGGTDFTAGQNLTITIPAGQAGGTISVDVSGDLLDENDETILVTLVGVTGAQLGAQTTSTVTILDNDAAPTVTISSPTATEGGNATFEVTLSTVSERDVTIKWVTENGTAIGGDGSLVSSTQGDFKQFTLEQTLVIPAGQKVGQIQVAVVNDVEDEMDETFGVRILETSENVTVTAGGIAGTATISANDLSTLTIGDATIVEGNSGTVTLEFVVSRQGSGNKLPVTVEYSTSDGTAKASAGDYVAANSTVTIPAGQSSAVISITVNGDTLNEVDETLFVTLRNPVNATISDGSGTGTIKNDEVSYKLVPVAGQSLTVDEEGAGGAEQIVEFKVIREGAFDQPGTVFFGTAVDDTVGANTATSGTDFFALNGSVSFLVGASEASQTIKLRIKPDEVPEGAETLKVKLNNPINGVLADTDAEQIVTITDNDDDKLPQVIISDAKLVEGNGGGTANMVFTVTLVDADGVTPKATGGSVVVKYSTGNGTALAGEDYTAAGASASITIAAGQTTGTITVPVTRDSIDEADETFLVNLTSADLTVAGVASPFSLALAGAAATGTILNDDLALTLDVVPAAAEGNADNTRTFTFRIPQASAHDVTVAFKTKDGTAVSTGAFEDFEANSGVVTILAGETEKSFTVLVHGDLYSESNEAFTLEFSNVTGAILASTSATVTLSNDDAAPSLTIGDATIVEGNAGQQQFVFTVTLAGGTQEDIMVDFATADGIARSSGPIVDYLSKTGTLTFPASATGGAQAISVTINGDTWKEINETFTVNLSNAKRVDSGTSVTIANATATGTIQDDGDATLGLFVTGTRVVEGDTLGGNLNFVVETTAPVTGSAVTFVANTRPGTAQTADYTEIEDQAVSIPVGQSTASVAVRARADTVFEPAEFMFLDLSGFSSGVFPIGASGGTVSAQGIILDDDVNIINGRSFQYVDTEGDIVTVKLSKGTLSVPTGSSLSTGDITFLKNGSVGGRFLQLMNLSNDGSEFAGTNISVTSRLQVLPDGTVLGDGKANVGGIESAVPVPGLFQFTTGVQLGKITVSGDLGRVIAGNSQRPAGVKSLNVGSFGDGDNLPPSSVGLATDTSVVLGPIGKMTVNGDFAGSLLIIGDAVNAPIPTGPVGTIGKLVVKGNLKGGSDFGTGRILTTGGINSVTLGGIVGGGGDSSATIQSVGGYSTSIGSLKILGDVVGGAGAGSASIDAERIGKITIGQAAKKNSPAIEADIIGGSGDSTGRIASSGGIGSFTMTGSLVGGEGDSSGQVFAENSLGKVKVIGDIKGGAGSTSGAVVAGVFKSSFTVEGDLEGGSGNDSGVLATNGVDSGLTSKPGNASAITIGKSGVAGSGNIIGGTGTGSGRIAIDGSLNKFTVYGNIEGGTGNSTGGIAVDGRIGNVSIKGSLIGGSAKPAADGGPVTLLRSGFIVGSGISSIVIDGQIKTGENLGADLPASTRTSLGGSAVIASSEQIGSITVRGTGETAAVLGNSTAAAIISARTSIGKATFNGDVEFAEILAGYSPVSNASAPRGTLTNLDATISKVIVDGTLRSTSIVAGINAGGDGLFGTIDDQSTLDGASQPAETKAIATIASVIAGAVELHVDSPVGAAYGIVAEHVKAVSVGGAAVSLIKGPHNDDATEVGGSASKLKVLET